jgi:hypothetical protein
VIDRLGGARVFHSRLAQWIAFLTLGIFALGFLWMLLPGHPNSPWKFLRNWFQPTPPPGGDSAADDDAGQPD